VVDGNDLGANDIVLVPGNADFRKLATWKRKHKRDVVDWLRAAYDAGSHVAVVAFYSSFCSLPKGI
jgi:putative intracellular protease/amidase